MSTQKPALSAEVYSRLLPDLFDLAKLEAGENIRVVDFGAARPETITFLNQFNCKLYIIDFYDYIKSLDRAVKEDPELPHKELTSRISKEIALPEGITFSVCLFWDLFNYMSLRLVAAFGEVLLPYLDHDFLGHGFVVLNRSGEFPEQEYGIADHQTLLMRSNGSGRLPYKHGQSAVNSALNGLGVKQSVLREDGRLEVLISYS